MASFLRALKKQLVLDMGTSAVRLCELVPTKTGHQLTKYYQREYGIDPAMPEEEQQALRTETLRKLLKEAKVRTRKTMVAVPGQSVFMRPRALPPVQEHKVAQIVRYEILQQIPFSLDQIAYDYQVLKRTDAGGYEVLMAAIKVEVVDKFTETMRAAKRQFGTVDVSPLAAYNWLKHNGELGDQGDCVALIDLGATTTDIIIEREGQLRFPRSINFGGNDITKAISAEFHMPFADAERLKRERGFAPTGDPKRDGKGGEVTGRVLNRLVAEINRSFAYFRSQPGGGPVSRVIVAGGGACLRNMVPYLQRQLGIEVRIAQPAAGLAIAPGAQEINEHPEQAAVVLGLALRNCGPVTIEIDLVPPRVVEAARRKMQAAYVGGIVLMLGAIMATVVPVSAQKNKQDLDKAAKYQEVLTQYDRRLGMQTTSPRMWESQFSKKLSATSTELVRLQDIVYDLDKAFETRGRWMPLLNAINEARIKALETYRDQPKIIAINTFESAVIAPAKEETRPGPGRPATIGGTAAGGTAAGGTAAGSAAAGGTTPGGGTGRRRTDDLEELDGGANADADASETEEAAPAPAAAPGAFGAQPAIPRFTVTPFAGSTRGAGAGALAGTTGTARPSTRGRGAQAAAPVAPQANAITITGLATDTDVITEFVEMLKQSEQFLQGGVYFSARDCNPAPYEALDGLVSGSQLGGGPGLGGPLPDTSQDTDRRGRRPSGISTMSRTGISSQQSTVAMPLRTFRIDLQYAGQPVEGGVRAEDASTTRASSGGEDRRERGR